MARTRRRHTSSTATRCPYPPGHAFDDIERGLGLTVPPHSLRHYFGSSLMSRGVTVVALSEWLGHSSPEITERVYSYLMANDQEVGGRRWPKP
ncbi:MAG: tyrosine-type recombinase/integrase [Pseudonocardiales bacterium]